MEAGLRCRDPECAICCCKALDSLVCLQRSNVYWLPELEMTNGIVLWRTPCGSSCFLWALRQFSRSFAYTKEALGRSDELRIATSILAVICFDLHQRQLMALIRGNLRVLHDNCLVCQPAGSLSRFSSPSFVSLRAHQALAVPFKVSSRRDVYFPIEGHQSGDDA
jgi:hypothetical protein